MNKRDNIKKLVKKITSEVNEMEIQKSEKREYIYRSEQCKEIKKKWDVYASVGDLLEFIHTNNIPNDAKILLQRVEDVYFEKNGWETINKEGENYIYCKHHNEDIKSDKYLDKNKYPNFKQEDFKIFTDKDLEYSKNKYYVCWCPVKYPDDDNLYLDAHY